MSQKEDNEIKCLPQLQEAITENGDIIAMTFQTSDSITVTTVVYELEFKNKSKQNAVTYIGSELCKFLTYLSENIAIDNIK